MSWYKRFRTFLFVIIVLFGSILIALTGCSGGNSPGTHDVTAEPQLDAALPFALPQIPTGENDVRQGTVVDSDTVQGSAFIESRGATIDGSAALIEAGTTPADSLAYGVYQHLARPDPAVPHMVSVLGYYQDTDPTDIDPSEGYYVLVADYDLNRWVTTGFYKTTYTRVMIPETADVVSPAGFIYTAVVAYQGNAVQVTNVYMGYDVGPGYDQYVLPEVPGLAVGRLCDIELDEAEVPQIAYIASSNLFERDNSTIRIASLVADEWVIEEITMVIDPRYIDFAIGSGGRRALIVIDDNDEQYLLFDPNTGTFALEYDSTGELAADKPISYTHPSITFINGADDPLGDLDTAISLYAVVSGGSEEIRYLRADGLIPTLPGSITGAASVKVRDLGLTTFADNMARACVVMPGLIESDCRFGVYDAQTDSWGPDVIADWEDLYIGTSDYEGVLIRELPTGDVVAAYRSGEEAAFVFGIWDGLTWTSDASDHISCSTTPSERPIDFEPSILGPVSFPTVYGNYSPVLYSGVIGNANPFGQFYINDEPLSCGDITLAVDSADVLHFAWERPLDGQLVYSTMEMGAMTGEQVVDYGADGSASSFGNAPIVANGDSLHIFHLDTAHGQIVYSRNVAGVWEEEQKPVLPIKQYPYILNHAGVLEDTGEIYVGYLDYFDYHWRVLISDATQENWRVVDITPFANEYMIFADDGSSIAATHYKPTPLGFTLLVDFDINLPTRTSEVVSINEDLIRDPISLAYNHFNGSWYLASNDGNHQRAYLFRRAAPGTWQGPITIDQQITGPTSDLQVFGLACRNSDGQLGALVSEIDDGGTFQEFSILTSDPETIAFGGKTLINTFDTALFDSDWDVFATTDGGGELAMIVIRHLLGDPLHDALMFTEEAGIWSFELWDSPVHKRLDWPVIGFAVMGSGDPAAALVEYDSSEPLYGRVFVYYPW